MEGDSCSVPPALRAALAAYPGFDADALDVRPLGTGLLHASFAVTTPRGEYVAQRVSPVFAPAIHDNIRAVTQHLAERGCPTLTLCETAAGRLYVDVADGERWRLMERLSGETFETCSGVVQAHGAGAVVGAFHSALADFRAPLAPMGIAFHDTRRYLDALRDALRTHGDHPRAPDVSALAGRIFDAITARRPAHGLPLRVVHGDLKFSNVLFAGATGEERERAVALIDLDTVCRLPIYFDVGDAWRSWSNRRPEDDPEAELDVDVFVAAAEGWRSRLSLPLEETERASLEQALENVTLELCARFATDVLREEYFAWDPVRFPSSSEHNWSRARGQWRLYEQAVETARERLRVLGE